ncbi:MAG TPA: diacylglycerol kinase family protein [Streptosporangiaceae bacterium]|nr:diacylglycerol kinase family protein [Streptosporangiaceae bacterium]
MHALLIVNPQATSTTQLRRDVIVSALASEIDLEVVQTRYRGDAAALAAGAADRRLDLVLTLGGDGTVNEAVNGLLQTDGARRPEELPALAPIPGGNANVFIRSLGLPADPIDATGRILAAIAERKSRSVGIGQAGDRYFIFCAGLGIDAEVVRAMEGLRAGGRKASDALYMWTALRQYYAVTDRRHPALTLERNGQPPVENLFLAVVSNSAPWTYLGRRPVNPNPLANFDSGLDVFALRRLRTVSTLRVIRQMLSSTNRAMNGANVVSLHDEREFTLRSVRPIAWQVDGEYMGEHECVAFRSIPHALRVFA